MSITEFVQSPAYKKIMGKVYGLGASVVILGALWKILHLPGASYMLIAGLGTEAIIFALSAFEPPHEMPDWSLVYPELVGLEPNEHGVKGVSHGGGGSDLAALIQSGHLESDVVEKLSDGIRKLAMTTNQLSNLSDANFATETYLNSMKQASESVGNLSSVQARSAKIMEDSTAVLANSYDSTAKVIAQSGTRIAEEFTASGKKFVDDLNKSSEQLVSAYSSLNQTMTHELGLVETNSKVYVQNLEGMNKNLASINTMFELQLKNTNEQVQASSEMTKGLSNIKDQLLLSVDDTKAYKDQVAKLSHSIGELNTIYGNMLSAMNMGNR